MIWVIVPTDCPSIWTLHRFYILPFPVIFRQSHKHQPAFLIEIYPPPVSTLIVADKRDVHITISVQALKYKSIPIMLQLKPDKRLTQMTWLHFSNACPSILIQELSEDLLYRREVENITR